MILQLCSQHRFKIAKVYAITTALSHCLGCLFIFPWGVFAVLKVQKCWWDPDGLWNYKIGTNTSIREELFFVTSWNIYTKAPPDDSVELHIVCPPGWLNIVFFAVFIGYSLPFPLEQWLHPCSFIETSLQSLSGNLLLTLDQISIYEGLQPDPPRLFYGLFVYTFVWLALFLDS